MFFDQNSYAKNHLRHCCVGHWISFIHQTQDTIQLKITFLLLFQFKSNKYSLHSKELFSFVINESFASVMICSTRSSFALCK